MNWTKYLSDQNVVNTYAFNSFYCLSAGTIRYKNNFTVLFFFLFERPRYNNYTQKKKNLNDDLRTLYFS